MDNDSRDLDATKNIRRLINAFAAEQTPEQLRASLENVYGADNVFDTQQLDENFNVVDFAAPYVIVRRLSDNKKGSLTFAHSPRFYFDFQGV